MDDPDERRSLAKAAHQTRLQMTVGVFSMLIAAGYAWHIYEVFRDHGGRIETAIRPRGIGGALSEVFRISAR